MKQTTVCYKNSSFLAIFAIVIMIGGVLRSVCCYWGYPLPLHPDEPTIVENAIDMLLRHSWNAYVYNRPDQFEIKCNAFLFTIVSWLKYRVPAYAAFTSHEMTFYLTARFYTAVFGIALIPLSAVLSGKISEKLNVNKKITQISSAFLIAFSAFFVTHSAYATPDIPLTFFIVLFAYMFLTYIEKGCYKVFLISCIVVGLGITIKYPAAILCIPLAFMVVYRAAVIDKKPAVIPGQAMKALLIICSVIFFVAPNLYTEIGKVYFTLLKEARPYHLGADGLGFSGNLFFYFKTAVESLGWESAILACIGLYTLSNARSIAPLCTFGIGVTYWVCMSILSLHWVRWGIPFSFFYNLFVAIGIGRVADFIIKSLSKKNAVSVILCSMLSVLSIAVLFNVFISGCAITKSKMLIDTCVIAQNYCVKHGITKSNTLFEHYTPFAPTKGYWTSVTNYFVLTDKNLKIKDKYKEKEYLMYTSSFRNRYFKESKRYAKQVNVFKIIEKSYRLVVNITADGNYRQKRTVIENVPYTLRYMFSNHKTSGQQISIYKLP